MVQKIKAEDQGEPEWLTPIEVAAALRRHPKTIRQSIRRGDIPGVKRSGQFYIPRAYLDEMRYEALARFER